VNEFVSEPSFSDELNVTLAYQQWSTINTLRLVSEEVAEVIAMAPNVPYCRLHMNLSLLGHFGGPIEHNGDGLVGWRFSGNEEPLAVGTHSPPEQNKPFRSGMNVLNLE